MNIKVKAGLIVVGMVGIAVSTILALKLVLTYIPPESLPAIGMAIILIGLLYLMYTMVLDRLKDEAKIQAIVDRNRK